MHGKSVSPAILVRKPTFRVWYQMLSSQTYGVSTAEIKSTVSGCVTSTMYSLAPMLSNPGISSEGSSLPETCRPKPECAKPTTAPCDLAQRKIGRSQVGQSSMRLVPG